MHTARRHFIKLGISSIVTMSMSKTLSIAGSPSDRVPIGFQLYTVRGEFAREVPGTLKKLAEIDLKALDKENLQRTIENNQALGSEYLNVAAAKEKMGTEEGIAELANLLNERSVDCKKHGMLIGYHAHPFDFKKIKGRFAWEILFSKTQPEVNMQMDVGNCLAGDGDPIAMLKEFPSRTRTIHIKEHKEKTFDSDFYKEVFRLCETSSGTKWYIVEMGGMLGNGFEGPKEALAKLHGLGK